MIDAPELADADAPRGVRLYPKAPLVEWHGVRSFATEPECTEARARRLNVAVERAQKEFGREARYDPELRRAVHARCVPAETLRAPTE